MSFKFSLCILIAQIFWLNKSFASTVSDNYYVAGVVEFRPVVVGLNSTDMLNEHLTAYIDIIKSPAANETDIIVFPEATLNSIFTPTMVPPPEAEVIPCVNQTGFNHIDFHPFFVLLSCAARDVKKYVVVNLKEIESCSIGSSVQPCPDNGWRIYNTNVVFDRSGRVVSRYRKWNLYLESNIERTNDPEYAIFETDFGVRFGHIICFDMNFYTPAIELVEKFGIRDIIVTTMWFSELPFLTAAQLQQSWAWGNDVNLLAAGASFPRSGSTGSGIYRGVQGTLVSTMVGGNGVRELLVARVPKSKSVAISDLRDEHDSQPEKYQNGVRLLKDPQILNFTSVLLNFTQSRQQHNLCQHDLCCDFDISTQKIGQVNETVPYYTYRIGVFDGQRSYEKEVYNDIRLCALYTCTNSSVESCGESFYGVEAPKRYVNFTSISITGRFKRQTRQLLMPNTLDTELYPLPADVVSWNVARQNDFDVPHIRLLKPQSDIMTFGIYGMYYKNRAPTGTPIFLLYALLALVTFLGWSIH